MRTPYYGEPAGQTAAAAVRWFFTPRRVVVDELPRTVTPVWHAAPKPVRLTWLGHASFVLQMDNGPTLLVDPVLSARIGPRWLPGIPRLVPCPVDADGLPPVHGILLTHSHYDHADVASLRAVQARRAVPILCGTGNETWLRRAGLTDVHELAWWEGVPFGNLWVTFTPARHSSQRGLFDQGRALWGGFHVASPRASVFLSGDTAWGPHFGHVRQRLGQPDVAVLPIGAYDPRWFTRNVHMSPEEAAGAADVLRAAHVLPCHYGTFALTDEPTGEPVRRFRRAMRDVDATLHVPAIGGSAAPH